MLITHDTVLLKQGTENKSPLPIDRQLFLIGYRSMLLIYEGMLLAFNNSGLPVDWIEDPDFLEVIVSCREPDKWVSMRWYKTCEYDSWSVLYRRGNHDGVGSSLNGSGFDNDLEYVKSICKEMHHLITFHKFK